MTVDLSKARKGDKVKFRCGGEFVLTADANGEFLDYNQKGEYTHSGNSRCIPIGSPHPFDIVAIEPSRTP